MSLRSATPNGCPLHTGCDCQPASVPACLEHPRTPQPKPSVTQAHLCDLQHCLLLSQLVSPQLPDLLLNRPRQLGCNVLILQPRSESKAADKTLRLKIGSESEWALYSTAASSRQARVFCCST